MATCNCPLATALTVIPDSTCPVDIKQIQKIVFQRGGYVWTSPAVDLTDGADWALLVAAADDTKVVSSPLIGSDPVIEAGEAITSGGGDNSTLNGVELVEGTNPSNFSCGFKSLDVAQENALKELNCELALRVYFINQDGKILVSNIDGTNDQGFIVQSFHFSDRNNAGFGTKDVHNLRFSLPDGWSEDLRFVTPQVGFNPLTDI